MKPKGTSSLYIISFFLIYHIAHSDTLILLILIKNAISNSVYVESNIRIISE